MRMYISCKAALMDKQEKGGRADSSPSIHGLLFDEDEDGGREERERAVKQYNVPPFAARQFPSITHTHTLTHFSILCPPVTPQSCAIDLS